MNKPPERHHFSLLDSFRFFAALIVLISHIEDFKKYLPVRKTFLSNQKIVNLGSAGVTFFFVLSGFLITFLLLSEHKKYGKISIPRFYIRRILRIWPLYFLIVLLSFFVLSKIHFFDIPGYDVSYAPYTAPIMAFYFLLLPQIPYIFYPAVPYANILWSIGVEELFYFFWPILCNSKINIKKASIFLILLWVILKLLIIICDKKNILHHDTAIVLMELFERNRFYSFAIGATVAYLHHRNEDQFLMFLVKKKSFLVITFAILISVTMDIIKVRYLYLFFNEIISVTAVLIIAKAIQRKGPATFPGSGVLEYFGKISYGIYCFHCIVIIAVLKVVGYGKLSGYPADIIIYFFSISITLVIAHFSYRYFEKYFIDKKNKYYAQ